MQKIVIDTNILFSFLLKENFKIRKILYNGNFKLFSTNHIIVELFKHKEKLLRYSRLEEVEIEQGLFDFLEMLIIIPWKDIDLKFKNLSFELLKDHDLKDIPFVALTLFLKGKLLTGDMRLKNYLIKKGYDICININDLI